MPVGLVNDSGRPDEFWYDHDDYDEHDAMKC